MQPFSCSSPRIVRHRSKLAVGAFAAGSHFNSSDTVQLHLMGTAQYPRHFRFIESFPAVRAAEIFHSDIPMSLVPAW